MFQIVETSHPKNQFDWGVSTQKFTLSSIRNEQLN